MINIFEMRKRKNVSQTELAKQLGVCTSTISMWETNKSTPRTKALRRIATVLGCTIDDLLREVPQNAEAERKNKLERRSYSRIKKGDD